MHFMQSVREIKFANDTSNASKLIVSAQIAYDILCNFERMQKNINQFAAISLDDYTIAYKHLLIHDSLVHTIWILFKVI